MSGGSYEYVYTKAPRHLVTRTYRKQLYAIAGRLRERGHEDVADEVQDFAEFTKEAAEEIEQRRGELSDILKVVERVDSGDSLPESIDKAVQDYTGDS